MQWSACVLYSKLFTLSHIFEFQYNNNVQITNIVKWSQQVAVVCPQGNSQLRVLIWVNSCNPIYTITFSIEAIPSMQSDK